MSAYEEKLISPLAILFSQSSIRPTFQDGHGLSATTEAIDAVPCDILRKGSSGYSVLLQAPFPPIEIVRMTPADSERERWITFDNRRLCCLQRAAAAQWPYVAAAVVKVRRTPLDYRQGTTGVSVNICGHNGETNDVWDWMANTKKERSTPEAVKRALMVVRADADAAWWDIPDPPRSIPSARLEKAAGATSVADLFNLAKRWEAQKDCDGDGPPGLQHRRAAPPQHSENSRRNLAGGDSVSEHGNALRNPGQEILSMLHGKSSGQQWSTGSTDPGQDILAMLQNPSRQDEEPTANAGQDILAMLRKPHGGASGPPQAKLAPQQEETSCRRELQAPPGIAAPVPAAPTPPPPPARGPTLEEELRLRDEEHMQRFRLQQLQQQQLDIQQFQLQELQRQQQLQQLQQYKELWHQKLQHAQLMQQFMLQPELKNAAVQPSQAVTLRAPPRDAPRSYADALVEGCAPSPCVGCPPHPACQPGLHSPWTSAAANPWAPALALGSIGCSDAPQWPASAMACSNAVGSPWLQGPGAVGADAISRR
mmetsp:Transcript_35381/g.64778  ORF Transcript_35381/g.64778 Transcript_35381/m.64778 type:complete len:538 (-) Transcript_35381:113-1726(-)